MKVVKATHPRPICLGRRGENLVRQVRFDVSPFIELYGEGTVQLIAQRVGDVAPYPVDIEMDKNVAVWTITNADTAVEGKTGKCELSFFVGDKLAKSEIYQTTVLAALAEPTAVAPAPHDSYVEKVQQAGIEAVESANNAKQSEENAARYAEEAVAAAEEAAASAEEAASTKGGYLPAVLDDDKEETYISTARTIRMGSTGENYNDDAQGERGLGEFSVTENFVGMAVRKDSTDETRRHLRLYDSNTYPDVSKAARLIDEDGKQHTLYGTHNPVVKRLWVNDTPTEEFAAGSMTVPGLADELVTAYDVIAIVFNATVEGDGRAVCFFHKGEQKVAAAVPGGGYLCERLVTLNDGVLYFGNGRYYKAYGATGRTNNNNYAIPLAVYKIQVRV